jgi:polysaccharide pyruvyl transferase WcaK-like protein
MALRRRLPASKGPKSSARGREYSLGFLGAFGIGNFGNDATLEACLNGVRTRVPHSRIMCVAANPASVTASHGIASFQMATPAYPRGRPEGRMLRTAVRGVGELGHFVRACRLLHRVRTFVIAGTGVLDDQHVRPTQAPLDLFRWSLAARLAGARLVFLSVGAGPIDQRWSRVLLTRAVRLAHEVSYRDQRSLEYMRTLGRDVRSDRVLPDLVLAGLPPESKQFDGDQHVPRIAIGLLGQMNWRGRYEEYQLYEDRIVQLVVRLANEGWDICLIKGDEVDVDTQLAILHRPEVAGLPVSAGQTDSFAEVVNTAAGCSAMIASRYHNVVAAVIVGIPVISLGYGPKNGALLEQLGATEWSHDIDQFSVDQVISQIADATRHSAELYRSQLDCYRDLLQREFEALTSE